MTKGSVTYGLNKAKLEDILSHLQQCDREFVPKLSSYVNITEYSNKIFKNAIKFEAFYGDKLVGLIAVYFNNGGKQAYITNVSVIKEYQGRKISSKLISNVIHYCLKHNFNTIKLEVFTKNYKAISLYKKFGFSVYGEKEQKVIMIKKIM